MVNNMDKIEKNQEKISSTALLRQSKQLFSKPPQKQKSWSSFALIFLSDCFVDGNNVGISTSCSAFFQQVLVFRPTFFVSSNLLQSEQFLSILRYWGSFLCLNWPCYHISQCYSGQFTNFL